MGCPDPLCRLSRPETTLRRHPRPPVRVSETRRQPVGKGRPAAVPTPAARAALVDRIVNGTSKVAIDISAFTPNPAVRDTDAGRERIEKGKELQKQYLGYLKELAATDVGFRLLSDLDRSRHKTTITFDLRQLDNHTKSDGNGAWDKKGAPPTVIMNPSLKAFGPDLQGNRDLAWMTEREKYGFYHELVHAWHITNGTQAAGQHKGVRNAEWQATGFGPHADAGISDNAIRKAMGKAERPTYNDVTY